METTNHQGDAEQNSLLQVSNSQRQGVDYYARRKEAISTVRKFAIAEEAKWREIINALDERYDAIEDAEDEEWERKNRALLTTPAP